jgi:late competence protein required for DNA uptake (superfamily II DNA/RNA helicase)
MPKRSDHEKLELLIAKSRREAQSLTRCGGVLITEKALREHRNSHCQGCGRRHESGRTAIYFGQEFCKDCVEKWVNGKR